MRLASMWMWVALQRREKVQDCNGKQRRQRGAHLFNRLPVSRVHQEIEETRPETRQSWTGRHVQDSV